MDEAEHVTQCDLLIIGSSMAGGCLARQMKLKHPSMNIVVVDRKTEFGHWVGESTLESFWDYAVRYLDLGFYLDTNHLYKHGLRFFYDSEAKDLPIDQMSEVGRSWFHGTPAHQLDRKKFDTDLLKMNLACGVDVRLGAVVRDIDIDAGKGHNVTTTKGAFRCRWLVDAAGIASPLGKKLDLIRHHEEHPISSWWGRFKNIANLDLLGDRTWRQRVSNTTRTLATTHFMYGPYWMWLIPIDSATFSIGVTARQDLCDVHIDNSDEFIDFLKQHRCMRQLITAESELIDFNRMKNISRRSKQIFSEDRWFMTGMSGAILDPLLSPGSAFLADTNRKIGDLIATDLANDTKAFERKVVVYNASSQHWLDNFFAHIKGHYHDCYDRQRTNFETLLMQWFGIILPASMAEHWGYRPTLTDEDVAQVPAMYRKMTEESAIHRVDSVVGEFHRFLIQSHADKQNNQGQFYDLELPGDAMKNTRTFGRDLGMEEIHAIEQKMVWVAINRSLRRMAEVKGIGVGESALSEVTDLVCRNNMSLDQGLLLLDSRKRGNWECDPADGSLPMGVSHA